MKLVEYAVRSRIGLVTLNRPEKRNALSHELVAELTEAFAKAEKDEQVKVIILKANGEAFCAGADLAYLQQLQKFSFEENLQDSTYLKELFLKIYTHPKIVLLRCKVTHWLGAAALPPSAILPTLFHMQNLDIRK